MPSLVYVQPTALLSHRERLSAAVAVPLRVSSAVRGQLTWKAPVSSQHASPGLSSGWLIAAKEGWSSAMSHALYLRHQNDSVDLTPFKAFTVYQAKWPGTHSAVVMGQELLKRGLVGNLRIAFLSCPYPVFITFCFEKWISSEECFSCSGGILRARAGCGVPPGPAVVSAAS